MKFRVFFLLSLALIVFGCTKYSEYQSFSGIYPHLAMYNEESECGTGAVVSWNDKLWAITYGPHKPYGSSDKLYEITSDLHQTIRTESTGGTPANRMIHTETNQLFIGPYVIDAKDNVRVISYKEAPGRYTGTARHLSDPENQVYMATMEEGFYEIDAHTLAVNELYRDGNVKTKNHVETYVNPPNALLPGAHGKGLYSGQGVLVYSNNGEATKEALEKFDVESGSLSEWDGKDWKLVRRNQFVEVTGPGGIYGNKNPKTDPVWATGWDYKSLILGVRDGGKWSFYRLPKASYTYDGAHGWNTEWPRIRNVGTNETPDYLMTMHGMFWRFPHTFSPDNTAGIQPRSAYLKIIGDFVRWNNKLVFGCDDSARKEFLNKRKAKGNIEGAGQSNSNLWFTDLDKPDNLGETTASGYVWLNESVEAHAVSEPFLFNGWDNRCAWIKNDSPNEVEFTFEMDVKGNNDWSVLNSIKVAASSSCFLPFDEAVQGEWIRVKTDHKTVASVSFNYASDKHKAGSSDPIFKGLARINSKEYKGGLLWSLGKNRRSLGILANDESGELGYYEIDGHMNFVGKEDAETADFIRDKFAVPTQVINVDKGSVFIVDDKSRRWRLPLGDDRYTDPTLNGELRICREVVTERDLFSCHGTFYELPAENADGYAKIRPISSHNLRISDYASYRGMMFMTGISPNEVSKKNPHILLSDDKKAAVWVGVIDDLWKLGKPIGRGGPWVETQVNQGEYSDPYLIGFYDKRSLELSHQSQSSVTFKVEVDPTGDGMWMQYKTFDVEPGEVFSYEFPQEFHARWIRFASSKPTKATAWLEYK